jgi:hypothetical protein
VVRIGFLKANKDAMGGMTLLARGFEIGLQNGINELTHRFQFRAFSDGLFAFGRDGRSDGLANQVATDAQDFGDAGDGANAKLVFATDALE